MSILVIGGKNLSVTALGQSLLLVAAHEDETKLAVNIRNDLFEMWGAGVTLSDKDMDLDRPRERKVGEWSRSTKREVAPDKIGEEIGRAWEGDIKWIPVFHKTGRG